MPFWFSPASPDLAPFVRQYWALEDRRSPDTTHTEPLVPSGLVEIAFYLDAPPRAMSNRAELTECALITGQQTIPYEVTLAGNVSMFSITLSPLGAMRLLPVPQSELADRTVPLSALGVNTREVVERMGEAQDFAARVTIAEDFLRALVERTVLGTHGARIGRSVVLASQSFGAAHISTLASAACLSVKQFERIFSARIGIRPKTFMRVLRFQNAIHRHAIGDASSLAGLAQASGYSDQSHMTADFKALSGLTPQRFFALCDSGSDYFASPPSTTSLPL